ncbi:MAG: hypothetical protein HY909_09850 [Deltaproteobacteria bacterium]|nr:hypothetical protein [Deltaproteobacteria bacterium]
MARAIDWNVADDDGGKLTFARTVILDDGSYREVHLTTHAGSVLATTTGHVERPGITKEQALEALELSYRIYGGTRFWASPPYDIPDEEAVKGDVRGF